MGCSSSIRVTRPSASAAALPPRPAAEYGAGGSGITKTPVGEDSDDDAHWRRTLTTRQYNVLRGGRTDPPGLRVKNGGFDDHFVEGTYFCAACEAPLYQSGMKFDCGCGWPGFWTCLRGAVFARSDEDGMRTEIVCSSCYGHLGHVFYNEEFGNPVDERHCVNSTSLTFLEWAGVGAEGAGGP